MKSTPRSRFLIPAAAAAALSLAACSGGSTALAPVTQPTGIGTISLRAVHGSPDAGPVDVYIYSTTGSQPGTPVISNLQYPGISQYYSLPAGSYTISIDAHGTTQQLATETLAGTTAGSVLSAAVAGQVANSTLQLQNFVEPTETAGTSAVIVHHASPAINAAVTPVGVGVYQATNNSAPGAAVTTQLFSFAIAAATAGGSASSGPATSGQVSGGEFFISSLPGSLPSPLGFAAGAPGASGQLASVATSTTLSGLAANLTTAGAGLTQQEQVLAQDTGNTVPAGAHLSIFAVDSTTSAPGILIGTLDP